jgi:monofunctional biosynthetic peptidoglycan transglycosylase
VNERSSASATRTTDPQPSGAPPVEESAKVKASRLGSINLRKLFSYAWKITVLALVIPIVQVAMLRFINPPFTAMMIFRSIDHLFAGESILWTHTNLGKDEVAHSLYSAIVAGEDQRFFVHHGFDMVEIENSQRAHARHPNRPMRGASTISQQLAKNLFLLPWRSFIRKGVEAYYTLLIEFIWPKDRILQTYANVVEFGPGIYGAEAAANFHFHKHAKDLTPQQSAQLAAVLPNPIRWSASKPTTYIQRRAGRILRQMRGIPTDEEEDGEPD